ncbi:MAG: class III poly(R)-hydroxyalkanoic acid synthase subunit PhaE [Gammaproteobacteria bacterium]|jgi:class III poly(R)-hydroxyalkanoic acid synthase PhaE subunit|nr:class III poly(R)-hydroxyalkanoic acid synthase subunit PhaE [Gammaproteobacteria bacterium]
MTQNPFFDDSWLKLQRDYWDSLANLGRQAMSAAQSGPGTGNDSASAPWMAAPWMQAMEQWRKVMAPAASDPAQTFMQRLMDQGQVYFGMVEQFTKGLAAGDTANAWEALNKTLDSMQQAFSGANTEGNEAMKRMLGFWELPLDNWQRMMSSLSPMMPGDLLRNMPHAGMPGPLQEGLDRMLSAPGLGYTREEQAQYQDLMRTGMDYQRAFQEYSAFFNQLGFKSLQRLRDQLQQKAEAGETIESARGLYDTWIGCCEAVYAEEVATPEYARLHGRLVNAQMALKQRLSVMVDESLGAMNMPTRGELRTLQDRLQETRRENKQLRYELDRIHEKLATLPTAPTPGAAQSKTSQAGAGQAGAGQSSASRTGTSQSSSSQPSSRKTSASGSATTKKTTARKKTAAKSSGG